MKEGGAFKIIPGIQHYAWGGTTYIPNWLRLNNDESKPFAEAWYGDHPLAPANAFLGNLSTRLNELIAKDPIGILGQESIDTYGTKMPFLLKILDVKDMLSLQLHPTKSSAAVGYQLEDEQGIPLNSPNRNYKDQNHKPEILFALSDFWMLQGFATIDEIKNRFESMLPEFKFPNEIGWRSLMKSIWDLTGEDYIRYTSILKKNLSNINLADKNLIYHWISKAFEAYPPNSHSIDRGLLVMLMLHVQYLKPGQVGYQAPGVIHAYLEGQNVELMANSDNVLRGGLTPKHIDPIELMKHLDTSTSGQCLIQPIYLMDDEAAFNPPVNDFWLKHYMVEQGQSKTIQFDTVSVLLNKYGKLKYGDQVLESGESLCIPAYATIRVESIENAEYFLAVSSL